MQKLSHSGDLRAHISKIVTEARDQYAKQNEAMSSNERLRQIATLDLLATDRQTRKRKSLPFAITARDSEGNDRTDTARCTWAQGNLKGKSKVSGAHLLSSVLIPQEAGVPKYKSWSYLCRNEMAVEVGRKLFYTDSKGETVPASDDDEEAIGDNSLQGIDRQKDTFIMEEIFRTLGCTEEVIMLTAKQLKLSEVSVKTVAVAFREEMREDGDPADEPGLEAYASAFCRICRCYGCLAHRAVSVKPFRKPAKSLMASNDAACSEQCRKLREGTGISGAHQLATTPHSEAGPSSQGAPVSNQDEAILQAAPARRSSQIARRQQSTLDSSRPWTAREKDLLATGSHMFGSDYCKLARLIVTRSCIEVARVVQASSTEGGSGCTAENNYTEFQKAASKKKRSAGRQVLSRQVVTKRAQHKQALWEEYVPCSCLGGCGNDCPCLEKSQFCEKFCACSTNCPHFFNGCTCSGGCKSKLCPCSAAGFECDPDVCKGCVCAVTGGDPPPGKERCQNMQIRLRQHKRTAIALSSIAGWGAFLLEPASKNELIGEYTGQLVDQTEAERRGKVYDRDDNSYLFNLNLSWVIDARMGGNKLRFANHSTEPNCSAKILMVDGNHRVGIFAIRDIPAGQELLYDYLYQPEQAPEWAQGP